MPTPTPFKSIQPGDTIGVMAPSSMVERDDIEASQAFLEARGFKVFVHPQTYLQDGQLAGTRAQKLEALHTLYANTQIKAIWAAGGGNRALDLVDGLDYQLIAANPKPLIGFSDVTALLNAVYAQTGTIGIHGPVFKQLATHAYTDQTLELLSSDAPSTLPLDEGMILRAGNAEGTLIGGNLSVFQYLPATLPNEFYEGKILFLEDCGDEVSRIDRMLIHLKRLGVLKNIAGLVIGDFIDMCDTGRPFGFDMKAILSEHMKDTDCPIILNAPFGHGNRLYPLRVGGQAELNMTKHTLTQYCY